MKVDDFGRLARNIVAGLNFVDPIDVFPGIDQSERRIRFRDNPHIEFLTADDVAQQRIAEIVLRGLSSDLLRPFEQISQQDAVSDPPIPRTVPLSILA